MGAAASDALNRCRVLNLHSRGMLCGRPLWATYAEHCFLGTRVIHFQCIRNPRYWDALSWFQSRLLLNIDTLSWDI